MLVWRQLAHAYPRGPTVRFDDLSLPTGSHLLLRGASGSGKSTLLGLLSGLLRVQCGVLEVDQVDLARLSPRQLDAWRGRWLGVVPQRLHLSEALTVSGNLDLPAWALGEPPDTMRATSLLCRLGIEGLADRHPRELSVGQAQRVAVARALMRRPRWLLADEPTASLDDPHAAQLLDLLIDAAQHEGCSLVVASHDARVFERLASRPDVLSMSLS